MKLFGIVGAGGFGREVMPLARQWMQSPHSGEQDAELVFVVENDYPIPQKQVNGHRVLSMDEFLSASVAERRFNIAIGNSAARERIANSIPADLATPFSVVAANHVSLDNNVIGEGAVLCSFSHITSNTKIGRYFHCNMYSYVTHDCVIGDFVTFAPGVKCNGRVIIEDHVYIGTGVIIKDASDGPIVIGRGAVIGMGAVISKSVAPGTTCMPMLRMAEMPAAG
ncbi:acetyltransferase [Undibacterium terreum]|uniref:GDP-perosamine N-acetyltransferase n=1 Tax=Undibacterium terreum TaxID=1224302 RepID=A0A916XHA2_9BURK|nr:acetyltransferase [Undibacterium terreum]GGC71776.1 GDP-perosamine N-acetyltransferase [Undibacterium terreum]